MTNASINMPLPVSVGIERGFSLFTRASPAVLGLGGIAGRRVEGGMEGSVEGRVEGKSDCRVGNGEGKGGFEWVRMCADWTGGSATFAEYATAFFLSVTCVTDVDDAPMIVKGMSSELSINAHINTT